MCNGCRGANGGAARAVAPLRSVGSAEPPCAVYLRIHDVRNEGDPWFPDDRRGEERRILTETAKAICSDCPLSLACSRSRAARDVGIWGGTEWQRDESRRYAVLADGSAA